MRYELYSIVLDMEEHTCITCRCSGGKSLGAIPCLRGNSASIVAPGLKTGDIVWAFESFFESCVVSRVGDVHQVGVPRLKVSLRPRQDHRSWSNSSLS